MIEWDGIKFPAPWRVAIRGKAGGAFQRFALPRRSKKREDIRPPAKWTRPPPWPCRPIKNLHVNAGGSPPLRFTASNVQTPPERAGRPAIHGASTASRIKDVGFKQADT